MKFQNFANATLLVTLIATCQIPDNRHTMTAAKFKDELVSLPHFEIVHSQFAGSQWIVHMDVRSCLIEKNSPTGIRLSQKRFNKAVHLVLEAVPLERGRNLAAVRPVRNFIMQHKVIDDILSPVTEVSVAVHNRH